MKTERKGYIGRDGLWKIYAKLCINGEAHSKKIKFIIDSGSGFTILSPDIAKDIGFGFDALHAAGAIEIGNSGECWARKLNNIDIILSHDEDENEEFMTLCDMYVPDPSKWKRNDYSLIGQDVLRQFNLMSDNKNNTIILTYVSNLTVHVPCSD